MFALSACSLQAKPSVAVWPEFNCSDNAVVITFVDLRVCVKASTYQKVEVLAGITPTIVFEKADSGFNALSYEPVEKALSGLASRVPAKDARQALDALFSWRDSSNLTPKQQALLQVFGISEKTQLLQFNNGEMLAYVRLNEGAVDNTIFMLVGNSSSVYRLIGNFSSADVQQWLSLININ